MKKYCRFSVLAVLAFATASAVSSETGDADVAEARGIVKSFAQTLKGRLTTAMSESGPVHAIEVCNMDAPRIAREHEDASDWSVARTSLKVRNPDNAPDQFERRVLEQFAERAAAGEDLAAMEHVETVERGGRRVLRYMKAIPMGEVCVACHGADLDPELVARIDALYPEDQARGFEPGELRGAFTLSTPLDQ